MLDHAGVTALHGFVEEPVEWSLDPTRRAASKAQASPAKAHHERVMRNCPECSALGWQDKPCRACGWRPRPKAEPIEFVDKDLALLRRDRLGNRVELDRRNFYGQLLGVAQRRGYQRGWAFHKFIEKFET